MIFGRRCSSAEAVLCDGECGEQAARLLRGLGGRGWAPRCTCTCFLFFFFPLSVGQLPLVVKQGQRRSMLLLAVPIDFISKPSPWLTYLSFLGSAGCKKQPRFYFFLAL